MNESEVSQYITDTLEGVDVVNASDASFFFYNPDVNLPPDHMFPFVTIVTNDFHDQFSNLDRQEVFRLNIGISKQTFRTLFGTPKLPAYGDSAAESDANDSDYDFTVLDKVMPHPVYGRMFWVCVLNPSDETFTREVQPLMAEAYELAVSKYNKKGSHSG